MKKLLLISLVLILASSMLLAQRTNRMHRAAPDKMQMEGRNNMATAMEELKLTDAQKLKFTEARAAFQKQQNTLNAEIKNLRLDIAEAMKAENIKRVKELNQQITAKQLLMKNARVDLMAAHMKELTKEQKEIMKKHMPMMMGGDQMRSARGERRAPGMGERMQDCDDCDDCDGERKYKHRK